MVAAADAAAALPASARRMEAACQALLHAIGEDTNRQGLLDTPKRVAKALLSMTEGHRAELGAGLLTKALFDEPDVQAGAGGLVLVRDVDFAALSAATLLPFYGRAHIAYVPARGVVLGLSKLARLVKAAAKQLHTQDGFARQLLHALAAQLAPLGALVVVSARHLDYTADQPPAPRVCAAASGCLAALCGDSGGGGGWAAADAPGAGGTATLHEALELLGAPLDASEVVLLPDAANPLVLLQPGCGCAASHAQPGGRSGGLLGGLGGAPACAACGSARLAPVVLRGMSASAGGLDSPRAPVTPDPSENGASDTDSSSGASSSSSSEPCCNSDCASALLGPGGGGGSSSSLGAASRSSSGCCDEPLLAPAAGAGQEQQHAACGGPSCYDGSTLSIEAALAQMFSEAGVDVAGPALQAALRRHVLALLSATSGYRQEQPSRPPRQPCCCCRCSEWAVQAPPLPAPQQQQQPAQPEQAVCLQQARRYRRYEHSVPFMSQCEHHMLPFHGTLHLTYLLHEASSSSSGSACCPCCGQPQPGGQAVPQPLSHAEAAQLVRGFTRRLQVQERITAQVAAAVQALLAPAGVMVVVSAAHMCMVARGVENHAGSTSTRAALGAYHARPELRCAFLRGLRQREQQGQQQQGQQQQEHCASGKQQQQQPAACCEVLQL